jgi:hypothetical protein
VPTAIERKHRGTEARALAAGTVRPLLFKRALMARVQSSFRIVPMPRFFVNSALLLSPNKSR